VEVKEELIQISEKAAEAYSFANETPLDYDSRIYHQKRAANLSEFFRLRRDHVRFNVASCRQGLGSCRSECVTEPGPLCEHAAAELARCNEAYT
jgi:hypothetical protein